MLSYANKIIIYIRIYIINYIYKKKQAFQLLEKQNNSKLFF